MKHVEYKTQGTCAKKIEFDLDGKTVRNIRFEGGCNGNLKAVAKLCEGKDAAEIARILQGNQCGNKGTSCADQLSKALLSNLE